MKQRNGLVHKQTFSHCFFSLLYYFKGRNFRGQKFLRFFGQFCESLWLWKFEIIKTRKFFHPKSKVTFWIWFVCHFFEFFDLFSRKNEKIFRKTRKFFPLNLIIKSKNAKVFVINFTFFKARKGFCPRKFLPLKFLKSNLENYLNKIRIWIFQFFVDKLLGDIFPFPTYTNT